MLDLSPFIISISAFIVALTIHEFSHALTAYLLGDPTAQQQGRLTLNPLAHIDPLGLLFLILVRFGWAKPVPFNPKNFRHPRIYSVLVGLAGPTSNFLLAAVCTFLAHHIQSLVGPSTIVLYFVKFLDVSIWINVMLGLFNLIPLPPLDGGHFLRALIPEKLLPYYRYFEKLSFILLIILAIFFAGPLTTWLTGGVSIVVQWLDKVMM